MRDKQKHKHRLERRSKNDICGTGFVADQTSIEQQFWLPPVGKEPLHDVSASATKPASADAKNVDQKTSLFGIPKGA